MHEKSAPLWGGTHKQHRVVLGKRHSFGYAVSPFAQAKEWRNRKLQYEYPYVYIDVTYLECNWGGEYENIAILVAMTINEDGYREVIGTAEGMREDKES